MQLKTPGVYVRDITPPQPFDILIDTALPAFIGHTEKAVDARGDGLSVQPVRIRDLTEYEYFFGGRYTPEKYEVFVEIGDEIKAVSVSIERQFYLYDCLLQFYENGGRDCFIVSVGTYEDNPVKGNFQESDSGFAAGLAAIRDLDEPSLILFPDAVRLPLTSSDKGFQPTDLGELQREAMKQCLENKDRFLIADLAFDERIDNPVASFRQELGVGEALKYGAAYYPWLYSNFDHTFRFRELTIIDSSTGDVVTDMDRLSSDASSAVAVNHREMVGRVLQRGAESDRVFGLLDEAEVIREDLQRLSSILSNRYKDFLNAYKAFESVADDAPQRASLLDRARQFYGRLMALGRALVLSFPQAEGTTLPLSLEMQNVLIRLRVERSLAAAFARLVAVEKHEGFRMLHDPPASDSDIDVLYADLIGTRWFDESASLNENTDLFDELKQILLLAGDSFAIWYREVDALEQAAENRLFGEHPLFREIDEKIRLERKKLPPSGAMAGLYAQVDRDRGVWKAPANIGVQATLGPTVDIDDHDQEALNVHSTGKSINAIRAFLGKGILVWGARTLDGNSNEWRYIPVRRYFNFVEEFVKKAVEPFVFDSNDATTWTNVRALLNRFLTVQWRQGALNGTTPAEAFFINIGLGQSMTAQDILEGRMIVEIGLAVVRPAEFIVVRYICRMEENL